MNGQSFRDDGLPRGCNRSLKARGGLTCEVCIKRMGRVCPVSLGRFDSGLLLKFFPWRRDSRPDGRRYLHCTRGWACLRCIPGPLAISGLASMCLSAFGHPQPTPGPLLPLHVSCVDRLFANHCQRRGGPNLRGHARSYSSSINLVATRKCRS